MGSKPKVGFTVNVRNPKTFGFQTRAVCSVVNNAEIRTILFGFRTFGCMTIHVRTFGFRTIYLTYAMNAEIRTPLAFELVRMSEIRTPLYRTRICSDFSAVQNPNVRISDIWKIVWLLNGSDFERRLKRISNDV